MVLRRPDFVSSVRSPIVNARLAASDLDLASAWEGLAAAFPDRVAIACGTEERTWAELDDRAGRLASAFAARGIGRDAKVAIALYNGNEYIETEFAAFKVRAVPANVNYRYRADEIRYVLQNSDAVALVYDASLREVIDEIRSSVPLLTLLVEVDGDGSSSFAIDYETLIAAHEPFAPIARSSSDQWFLYTGGTTGQPKAVMWEHRGLLGGMESTYRPFDIPVPTTVAEVVAAARIITERGTEVRQIAASPLMHGTAGVSTKATLTHGGVVITLPSHSFDPDELFRTVEHHRATMLTIVGDAFSRPMLAAIERAEAEGRPYDLSSVRTIVSSGIMWSEEIKQEFLRRYRVTLVDILGSSEGTGMARQVASRTRKAATARFELGEHSRIFTDDGRDVVPGSGETGRIALGFPIPVGYYKDPVKTEEAFPLVGGRRWSIPGDYALVEADGTVVLLGRGSQCINTGGEKVFPEEVEESLKTQPAVIDANVIGVADEQWGSAVTALVSLVAGATVTADVLRKHVRDHLAAYKAPKRVVFVPEIVRKVNGKPDYEWARATLDAVG
jgi:acyl-CoA synthetase (AMP-forming)/AMP-acid ligase II